jgi:hypothetical protein
MRLENPISKKYTEHALKSLTVGVNDNFTHLYTLIIDKNDKFTIKIDNEVKDQGSLLDESKFVPPIVPEEKIADPEEKKPGDWVDEEEIADEKDVKPEDWDEEEPLLIPDPNEEKPDNWDQTNPGEEWKASKEIKNPKYKGKYIKRKIPNPLYKGEWKNTKEIPNPLYYSPSNIILGSNNKYIKLYGIGLDILSVTPGQWFSSIYIGSYSSNYDELVNKFKELRKEEEIYNKSLENENKLAKRKEILENFGQNSRLEDIKILFEYCYSYLSDNIFLGIIVILLLLFFVAIIFILIIGACSRCCGNNDSSEEENNNTISKKKEDDKEDGEDNEDRTISSSSSNNNNNREEDVVEVSQTSTIVDSSSSNNKKLKKKEKETERYKSQRATPSKDGDNDNKNKKKRK